MSTRPTSGATPARPGRAVPRRSALLLILLALVVVLAMLLLLTRCGGGTPSSDANRSPSRATSPAVATTTVTATATPSTPASSAPPPSSSAPSPSPVVGSTNLTANGVGLLPLSASAGAGGDLSRYAGQPVTARSVQVISVPALNGFWVGTSATDEIWVQLLQPGQVSPHAVRVGDHVSFTGATVTNPPGFSASAGVSAAEGAAMLTAEKAYIETNKSDLTLS